MLPKPLIVLTRYPDTSCWYDASNQTNSAYVHVWRELYRLLAKSAEDQAWESTSARMFIPDRNTQAYFHLR